MKGISPKMCILCVRVKINKRSFEAFCVSNIRQNRVTFVHRNVCLVFVSCGAMKNETGESRL